MDQVTTPKELNALLEGGSQFALIDVREPGEYMSSHIPGSSMLPRRQIEFQMTNSVPYKGALIVVCDDDCRRAGLAATTLERMGFTGVSVLDGGIKLWVTLGYPTEWGTNVPSKDFGEKVEVIHSVPEIDAPELQERIERGERLVILDTRTPKEYSRFCIPCGRSVPGGELALRITDIMKDHDPDTSIVVNCAGRTRSIIGTRVLQRMGFDNVHGLKNGTSGWVLAGYEVERGASRVDLPEPSPEGQAAAESYATRLAAEDGVRYLDVAGLQEISARRDRECVYLIDVRTKEEYEAGHIPGFRWFPGGQAVQRSDDLAVVHNSTIVFTCDGKARATITASWYRQMGFRDVYAVDGGTAAWSTAGLILEQGMPGDRPFGLQQASPRVRVLSPRQLNESMPQSVLFVESSLDFAQGHIPGAHWIPRGWLEFQVGDVVPSKGTSVAVTCNDGRQSVLAGATLLDMGYREVSVLEGGMDAWRRERLPLETGLTGVMSPPRDVVILGVDRNPADMMHYLCWETALGHKYGTQGG